MFGTATRNPSEVTYYLLTDVAAMGVALGELQTKHGYTGSIAADKDIARNITWRISVIHELRPNPVTAEMGQVLIWDGQSLSVVSQATFDAEYTQGEGL